MAFPTLQTADTQSGTDTSTSTSTTVTLPTNISSGDLLFIFFYGSGTDGTPNTAASGWTLSGDRVVANSVGHLAYLYRVADGTEGSTVSVSTDVAEDRAWIACRVTGWHGTTPPEHLGWNAGGNSTTADPPSVTPSWGAEDTLWIAVAGSDSTNGDITSYPTDYSIGQVAQVTSTSAGGACGMAARQLNAASEDPGTFGTGNARAAAFTIAVRPAAGATNYTLTAESGSIALTGSDVGLYAGRRLVADTGAHTLTGQDVALTAHRRLVVDAGTHTVTGQDVSLLAHRRLDVESGSYVIAGQEVGLYVGRVLQAESGTFTVTGSDVTLSYNGLTHYTLTAETGTVTLTGSDVGLYVGRRLLAETGTVTITGNDVGLLAGRVLQVEPGTFTITGSDVSLVYSAASGTVYEVTFRSGPRYDATNLSGPQYKAECRSDSRYTVKRRK